MTNSIETRKPQIYRADTKCISFAIFYASLARRLTARSSAVGIPNGSLLVKPTGKLYRLHNICSKGHFRDSTASNLILGGLRAHDIGGYLS